MPHLVHLRTENFKAIELVEVDLHGNVITVTGENDSGKSSLIDSIAYLFAGKAFKPDKPIRNGAGFTQILGKLDNGLVLKRRTTETKDTLTIESAEGATFKSPQTVADKMFNPIAFDPDAFTQLSAKDQAAMLRKITGLNTAVLDAQRKDLLAMIAAATAAKKALEAQREQLSKLPTPPPDEIPEVVDIAAIASEMDRHGKLKRDNDAKRRDAAEARALVDRLRNDVAKVRKTLTDMEARLAAHEATADSLTEAEKLLADPPTGDLDSRLAQAKAHNAEVYKFQQIKAAYDAALDAQTNADLAISDQATKIADLNERKKAIDAEKTAMLEKANMPVEGMTVEDDEVFIKGVPYSQISASEQIKIGLIMSQAGKQADSKQQVRICLIRDGDRLDDNKRRTIHEWAVANDIMVFEERVARDGVVGIHLEHGRVKGAPLAEAAVEEVAADVE